MTDTKHAPSHKEFNDDGTRNPNYKAPGTPEAKTPAEIAAEEKAA